MRWWPFCSTGQWRGANRYAFVAVGRRCTGLLLDELLDDVPVSTGWTGYKLFAMTVRLYSCLAPLPGLRNLFTIAILCCSCYGCAL